MNYETTHDIMMCQIFNVHVFFYIKINETIMFYNFLVRFTIKNNCKNQNKWSTENAKKYKKMIAKYNFQIFFKFWSKFLSKSLKLCFIRCEWTYKLMKIMFYNFLVGFTGKIIVKIKINNTPAENTKKLKKLSQNVIFKFSNILIKFLIMFHKI